MNLEEVEEVACPSCANFNDVCLNYNELNSPTRRSTNAERKPVYCDKRVERDWKGPGWYRITGEAGSKQVDSEVDKFHCGTPARGWLSVSGGHPTVAEGEVDRIVNFHRSHQVHDWRSNVKVINWNTHYFYFLVDAPNCDLGYCTE